jgi:hypothetical protein
MVLTVCFVLSPAIGLSCHRRQRMKGSPAPGRAGFASADLTPASRRQDHTTSLSASASFVGTPSDRSRETRPATTCAPDAAASTASRPNVRDDGQRPSSERDGDSINLIWVCGEAISSVLPSSALQRLGLWSYSIYMIHTFVFQAMKIGASFIGQKAKLDLVGWHHDEKLMLLGTPGQALLPARILSVVLVVPIAALTYRWIEKPAMDAARRGLSTTRRTASGIASPAPWLRAGSVPRVGFILRWRARSLVLSARASIGLGLGAVRAVARRGTAQIGT